MTLVETSGQKFGDDEYNVWEVKSASERWMFSMLQCPVKVHQENKQTAGEIWTEFDKPTRIYNRSLTWKKPEN